ncbi:hypothetical protein D9M72_380320 [compost metagenome]
MRDVLQRVRDAVGEVVHRVDAPLVARAVVMGMADAVEHRVAHHDIGRGHVDLRAQHVLAVGVLAGAHVAEQLQVLFDAALAVGRGLARLGEIAAVGGDLFGGLAVDIGGAALDQGLGKGVELVEVVAGVVQVRLLLAVLACAVPGEAEPVHGVDDRIDVFGVFLDRVGVVEAQVAAAAVVARQPEVHADALGVADMQVAVGLRREACDHGRQRFAGLVLAAGIGAGGEVLVDDAAQEVGGGGGAVGRLVVVAHDGAGWPA